MGTIILVQVWAALDHKRPTTDQCRMVWNVTNVVRKDIWHVTVIQNPRWYNPQGHLLVDVVDSDQDRDHIQDIPHLLVSLHVQ